jgi:hypothetical protein
MKLKYLVTGTGRCGTVYMARLLTTLGVNCGHEAIFSHLGIETAKKMLEGDESQITTSKCSTFNHVTKEKIPTWFQPINILAESSYMAAPFLDDPILDGVKVVHLVRNPLKVLSSWVIDIQFFNPQTMNVAHFRKFIYQHLPKIQEENSEIEKACRYLIEWNKIVEKTRRDKILVRIEDFPYVNLINFLDEVSLDKIDLSPMKDKKINSWKRRDEDLCLSDIPEGNTKKDFVKMMIKYGYLDPKEIANYVKLS